MKIKGKPDVTQFLEGGAAAESHAPKNAVQKEIPGAPKRQKLVELPKPVFDALKDRAHEEYKKTGRRVTETEIIITALSEYLGLS